MSDVITFAYLREVQKKERSTAELCKLDANFYGAVSDYILRKKRIKERGKELSFKEKREIENIAPVVKSIYDTRETKIINGALKAARGGIKTANLLKYEEELFCDVKKRIVEARSALASILEPKKGADDPGAGAPGGGGLKLKIVEDVPEFVGENLETYGPWKTGQIVECPAGFYDMFIKSGKAEPAE